MTKLNSFISVSLYNTATQINKHRLIGTVLPRKYQRFSFSPYFTILRAKLEAQKKSFQTSIKYISWKKMMRKYTLKENCLECARIIIIHKRIRKYSLYNVGTPS